MEKIYIQHISSSGGRAAQALKSTPSSLAASCSVPTTKSQTLPRPASSGLSTNRPSSSPAPCRTCCWTLWLIIGSPSTKRKKMRRPSKPSHFCLIPETPVINQWRSPPEHLLGWCPLHRRSPGRRNSRFPAQRSVPSCSTGPQSSIPAPPPAGRDYAWSAGRGAGWRGIKFR